MSKRKKLSRLKGLSVDKGQFVKTIGYAKTKSGAVRAKTHYLGSVEAGATAALLKAAQIKSEWEALKATGATVWAEAPSALNKPARIDSGETEAAPQQQPKASTIGEVAAVYLAELEARCDGGQITTAYAQQQRWSLNRVLTFVEGGSALPLAAFDRDKLNKVILAIAARPLVRKSPGQKSEGQRRMATKTAKVYLSALKWFLNWTADDKRWDKPKGYEQLFKQNKPVADKAQTLLKLQELQGSKGQVKAFTLNDLSTLYASASERQRLFILLSLNCGFANEELNDLKRVEVFSDNNRIGRFRGKTERNGCEPVYAQWELWAETRELLTAELQRTEGADCDGRALLTLKKAQEGNGEYRPLIEYHKRGRRDSVAASWVSLYRDRLPEGHTVQKLPFKFLRKTGASFIRGKFGKFDTDLYLSHSENAEMVSHYAGREWDKLAEATAALRQYLEPMFAAATLADAQRKLKAEAERLEAPKDVAAWRKATQNNLRQLRMEIRNGNASPMDKDVAKGLELILAQKATEETVSV